jgi:hypothetical protein
MGDGVGELAGIRAPLHALPVEPIPVGALVLGAGLHAGSGELVGIGEVGGGMSALGDAQVVVGISVVVIG